MNEPRRSTKNELTARLNRMLHNSERDDAIIRELRGRIEELERRLALATHGQRDGIAALSEAEAHVGREYIRWLDAGCEKRRGRDALAQALLARDDLHRKLFPAARGRPKSQATEAP